MKLTVNPDIADAYFIYSYFRSKSTKKHIESNAIVGGVPHINLGILKNIEIELPPLEVQKKIVGVLRGLDDKITLNRQINQTLEQMAQTLFKSWFVDFDPVIDNALDAGNDIPDTLQERAEQRRQLRAKADFKPLPAATRALFPSEFEETELGWVPKGWVVSTYAAHAEFVNGYAFKSEELTDSPVDAFPVFKMGNIKRGGGFNPEGTKSFFPKQHVDSKLSKFFTKKGDLLMSMTDMKSNVAILGNTALMTKDNIYLQNQRVGRLRCAESSHINYPYFYFYSNEKIVVDELRSRANSGVQVNLTSEAIKSSLILVPSKQVHDLFDKSALSYLERMFHIDDEINSLSNLRDILLPKLISGELALDDLPEETAEVAEAL